MADIIHYLDNAATTSPSETVKRAICEAVDVWGNPSSRHTMGMEARRLLDLSREAVLNALGVRRTAGGELIFTSSGTEANCLATLGFDCAKKRVGEGKSPVMILTDGEHPSIEMPAGILESRSWRIIRIPTVGGELDLDALRRAVSEPCSALLACFMLVNNETGALYDVKRAASIVHASRPDAHVHCDAVQGFMKTKFTPLSLGVDSIAVSAHKIHSIRGAGALYITADTVKKKNIAPVIPGGGQEKGFRSGTENLVSVAAFAAACAEGRENYVRNTGLVAELSAYLKERLSELESRGVTVKKVKNVLPDIVNITLPRIKSETMLNYLSGKGICVSAGSACSASDGHLSRPLAAFGCSADEIDSSVRISISYTNTKEDIDALISAIGDGVSSLARF